MQYQEHPPPAALAGHVDAFWTLESRGPAPPDVGTILPDGSVEIVFSLADPVRAEATRRGRRLRAFVVGQMERPWRVQYTGRVRLVGVRLHPAATRTFIAVQPDQIVNRIVALADVSPDLAQAAWPALVPSGGVTQRVARLHPCLLTFVAARDRSDPLVRRAVDRIRARQGHLRLSALYQSLPVTARQLQRRFQREVGLPPKRWARVVRFQSVLTALAANQHLNWADVAGSLGYADQAHLVREFGEFTGVSPGAAWRSK